MTLGLFAIRSAWDEARAGETVQRTKTYMSGRAGEQQSIRSIWWAKKGWRAVPPALAEVGYGCFLPDLTRFTTMQCGAARRCSL